MNSKKSGRREFVERVALAGFGASATPLLCCGNNLQRNDQGKERLRLKLSLNAYSFNKPLMAGTMNINDLLDFCSKTGFEGVDLTGYYIPGYPAVPSDKLIYSIKKKAYSLGLDINATGVRNDFTWSDPEKRLKEKEHIKEWIVVAQKFGAPSLRIFTGNGSKEQFTWKKRASWIADEIRDCADFAANHGVILALQNHHDFLKTAGEVEELLKMINHEWVGLMLDIGSYHTSDPYDDIARNAKYAVSWQMKENIFIKDTPVETDYVKVIKIVRDCGFKGYLPIETLGEGDPVQKVEDLYKKVASISES